MGLKQPRSTILMPLEEAAVLVSRRLTLLPLDDCVYALQPSLPHLTRSSFPRWLQRHGIARLREMEGETPRRSRFRSYPIGHFHVDIAEVHTEEGRLYDFVAIDRTSKLAFAQLHERATQRVAANFLYELVEAVPRAIHTVLTDNGAQLVDSTPLPPADVTLPLEDEPVLWRVHAFEKACEQYQIEHRLTKAVPPVDEWASRADEPHHHGCRRPAL